MNIIKKICTFCSVYWPRAGDMISTNNHLKSFKYNIYTYIYKKKFIFFINDAVCNYYLYKLKSVKTQ